MQTLKLTPETTLEEIQNLPASFYNEIVIDDIDKINIGLNELFGIVSKKLRSKGEIKLEGKDLSQIAHAITTGFVPVINASSLLYDGSKQISSIGTITTFLEANSLKVMTKKYTANYRYYIVAQRKELGYEYIH